MEDLHSIQCKLLNYLIDRAAAPQGSDETTDLIDSGILDSLMLMDLVLHIQMVFGIELLAIQPVLSSRSPRRPDGSDDSLGHGGRYGRLATLPAPEKCKQLRPAFHVACVAEIHRDGAGRTSRIESTCRGATHL